MSESTASPTPAPPSGPTSRRDRALAPDVARGLVLLGIAVANVPFLLWGRELGLLFKPVTDAPADPWVNAAVALLADNRSYPLFALLFGYGLTQILSREHARGTQWRGVRRLLVSRNLWLIAFGAVHGVLLFFGDILGAYGLLGLALVLLIRASGKILAIVGWISFGVLAITGFAEGLTGLLTKFGGAEAGLALFTSPGADTYLLATLQRALEWSLALVAIPFGGFGLLAPMILGMWAARRRMLEEPGRHRRALGLMAGIGVPVSLLGALPMCLALLGVWEPGILGEPFVGMLHVVTGAIGGAGYVALIALLVGGAGKGGPISRLFAALGQRSLSGYLAQSVVFLVLFAPYTFGLGGTVSVAEATQIAVLTWLGTLIAAAILGALDKPGPAEWLYRRIVYRRRPALPAPATAPI
ncbi:MAG: DUF418 domain-containing protein [Microcella sp.]|uniref:DUF418 domain-containing protein n=1 Tax=Microcella sp. TaxID=1913979 RepID=UPI003314D9CF